MAELRRIVLAEDSPNDVELTLAALADHKLANEVIVLRDGAEVQDYLLRRGAYAARRSGNPAVLFLDLKMPKLGGLEVLKWMRSEAAFRTVPVVVLTSSREEPDIAESYKLGVNAYVVKPVAFDDFVKAVKNVGLFWAVLNEPPPQSAQASR
jgi:CheY-like chemotaxis protein